MSDLDIAAQAAYESIESGQTAKRIPWSVLPEHWREYWRGIARAVLAIQKSLAA